MKKLLLLTLLCFLQGLNPAMAQRIQDKAPQGFPHKDGPFSAMLMVLDQESLKEFEKPSSEGLYLQAKNKVKRGETVLVKIGFMGMQLDMNMNADVTYDFKILDPDGKTAVNEARGVLALSGKVVNPFMVFNTQSHIDVGFEESDKSGVYKFVATITDNIGKRSIPLEAQVELVD